MDSLVMAVRSFGGRLVATYDVAASLAAAKVAELRSDERGSFGVDSVWDIAFMLIFLALLIPIGISQLNSTDTSGWDSNQVLVWGLLGTIAILVIAYAMYKSNSGSLGGGGRRRSRGR